MDNKAYVKRIITIILLTNIPAILTLLIVLEEGLGWILGSLASAINFYWLAFNVKASLELQPSKSKLKAVKGTYLRLIFLLIYSILVLSFIKPNLISFGLGLLAAQVVIYLNELAEYLKKSKYFRG
ncbi:MAG: hypothetical protein DRH79_02565 [Candidatus Cloacimonadota bacterium]|nr:MAG: hypothetical protein DRH79_02565 [Candidatus Cloacimonadota bacterium]